MNIFRVFSTILYPLFVYVLLSSGRNLVESSDAGASTIPGSGTKTGVDLSLKKTSGTNEFSYNKTGRVVTYTAKDGFGFKSVKTGNKVVWSTSNSDEYATKVVLDGKGKKEKKVTIYLPNNTTKVFNRSGKGKPWTDVSQQGNQSTGQPRSGTPASGSNGMTGGGYGKPYGTDPSGHGGPYGSSGHTTGGGHGMSHRGRNLENDGSYGTDPNGHGMTGGSYGMSYDRDVMTGGVSLSPANESSETHTRTGSGPVTTPPDRSGGDGSTPVTTPQTNLSGSSTPPNEGQSSKNLSGGSSETAELKLFKDDGSGNAVEMIENTDFERSNVFGSDTYRFKDGVKCTLVKYNDEDVWKKGDQGVNEPSSVTYNSRTDNVVVSDGKYHVFYSKNASGKLVHSRTRGGSGD